MNVRQGMEEVKQVFLRSCIHERRFFNMAMTLEQWEFGGKIIKPNTSTIAGMIVRWCWCNGCIRKSIPSCGVYGMGVVTSIVAKIHWAYNIFII